MAPDRERCPGRDLEPIRTLLSDVAEHRHEQATEDLHVVEGIVPAQPDGIHRIVLQQPGRAPAIIGLAEQPGREHDGVEDGRQLDLPAMPRQLRLEQRHVELEDALADLDPDSLSPREALDALYKLKKLT